MSAPRRYRTVDVFTDRLFGGNPLAVVLDAEGLTTGDMQALAAEFNYSETSFVLPPEDPAHTARVRIFTPRAELPFAGHPNVGTAFVLAREGWRTTENGAFLFAEAAGLVPVMLLFENGAVVGAELTAPEPFRRVADRFTVAEIAACLGLAPGDILTERHGPEIVSVGLSFVCVEIASRSALARIAPDMAVLRRVFPRDGTDAIHLYTRDVRAQEAPTEVQARMVSPLHGIPEDPATGSATAAAAGLLAALDKQTDGELRFVFGQGVDMGRPSALLARVTKRGGRVETVRVGGRCVAVMEGAVVL